MAHKKKLTSKERKAQQRAELERRHGAGWQPPTNPDETAINDALPLLQTLMGAPDGEQRLMLTLLDSGDLADEPELQEIFINPMQAASTFAEIAMKLDPNPQSTFLLSEKEQDEIQAKIQEKTTQKLLTKQVSQQILDGLNKLRLRLRDTGDAEAVGRVALIIKMLNTSRKADAWADIGVVQAIIQRSVGAGMELMQATMDMPEDLLDDPVRLREYMDSPEAVKRTRGLLDHIPGLRQFMTQQADEVWETGEQSTAEGKWNFRFFAEDEIHGFGGLLRRAIGLSEEYEDDEEIPDEVAKEGFRNLNPDTLVASMEPYVTTLFTPERLVQLRERLHEIGLDQSYTAEQIMFATLLVDDFAEDDAAETMRPFLIRALFGELRARNREQGEDNDE